MVLKTGLKKPILPSYSKLKNAEHNIFYVYNSEEKVTVIANLKYVQDYPAPYFHTLCVEIL